MDWVIREATAIDAASIARVNVDSWRTTYVNIVPQSYLDSLSYEQRTTRWQGVLSDSTSLWFTYVTENVDGNIIGFAGGGPESSGNEVFTGELGWIYLLKEYQRQGIGRKLMAKVVLRLNQQGHSSILVWVFTANPYKSFYEALGGRPVGEREVYKYGANLVEIAYGWQDLSIFTEILEPDTTF